MTWHLPAQQVPALSRIDLRLAQRWRIGGSKAEAALTVQALNGDQIDGNASYQFKRRAFLTLKLEN